MPDDFGQRLSADPWRNILLPGQEPGSSIPMKLMPGISSSPRPLVGRTVGSEFQADAAGIGVFVKAIVFSTGREDIPR